MKLRLTEIELHIYDSVQRVAVIRCYLSKTERAVERLSRFHRSKRIKHHPPISGGTRIRNINPPQVVLQDRKYSSAFTYFIPSPRREETP